MKKLRNWIRKNWTFFLFRGMGLFFFGWAIFSLLNERLGTFGAAMAAGLVCFLYVDSNFESLKALGVEATRFKQVKAEATELVEKLHSIIAVALTSLLNLECRAAARGLAEDRFDGIMSVWKLFNKLRDEAAGLELESALDQNKIIIEEQILSEISTELFDYLDVAIRGPGTRWALDGTLTDEQQARLTLASSLVPEGDELGNHIRNRTVSSLFNSVLAEGGSVLQSKFGSSLELPEAYNGLISSLSEFEKYAAGEVPDVVIASILLEFSKNGVIGTARRLDE